MNTFAEGYRNRATGECQLYWFEDDATIPLWGKSYLDRDRYAKDLHALYLGANPVIDGWPGMADAASGYEDMSGLYKLPISDWGIEDWGRCGAEG